MAALALDAVRSSPPRSLSLHTAAPDAAALAAAWLPPPIPSCLDMLGGGGRGGGTKKRRLAHAGGAGGSSSSSSTASASAAVAAAGVGGALGPSSSSLSSASIPGASAATTNYLMDPGKRERKGEGQHAGVDAIITIITIIEDEVLGQPYTHSAIPLLSSCGTARLRALGIDRQMLVDLGFENEGTRAVSARCLACRLGVGSVCESRFKARGAPIRRHHPRHGRRAWCPLLRRCHTPSHQQKCKFDTPQDPAFLSMADKLKRGAFFSYSSYSCPRHTCTCTCIATCSNSTRQFVLVT